MADLMPTMTFGDPGLSRWFHRSPVSSSEVSRVVTRILDEVRENGAEAVLANVRHFDAPHLDAIWVSEEELSEAQLAEEDLAALRLAIERVRDFHEVQLGVVTHDYESMDPAPGWFWRTDVTDDPETGFEGQRLLPVARAGVYVPGGRAAYPSSVLMNVIPAQVAGVREIVVASPPARDGRIADAVLVACRELGISRILKAGGAVAIGAMALGLPDLPRVDVIVGPGNVYVNEAKRQVWGGVGLDGYAGPSEVAVLVDGSVDARSSAADLLTQVEHAPDNVGMLIATSDGAADAVLGAAEALLYGQAHEKTMRDALRDHGVVVRVDSLDEAVEVLNQFAPEHASLHVHDAANVAIRVVNCGYLHLGPYSPQAAGDYLAGPSHTLPTSGAARFASPVNVSMFLKVQSLGMMSAADVTLLAPAVTRLAELEGFPMHGRGASIRLPEE